MDGRLRAPCLGPPGASHGPAGRLAEHLSWTGQRCAPSALGCDEDRYVAARAIQLFARGVPQIYCAGLPACENDSAAVKRTWDGRAVNRHDDSRSEAEEAIKQPVVRRLIELVRLRNTHPAFDGALDVGVTGSTSLRLGWRNPDAMSAPYA